MLHIGVILACLTVLTSLTWNAVAEQPVVSPSAGTRSASDRPPVSAKPPPHPLADVTAIIEADVVSAQYTFSDTIGPRTEVILANIVVHAGQAPAQNTFSQAGGLLPDGRYMSVSDLPVFNPGARYLMFFGPNVWFDTPIWSGIAFRIESIAGKRVALGPSGRPVIKFGLDGVAFGSTKVVDPRSQRDPLRPLVRDPALDIMSLPDIGMALDVAIIGQIARDIAVQLGAPLGSPRLSPQPRPAWNVIPTEPPANL